METVVIIIMAAVCFSFILKLTCHRTIGAIILSVVAGIAVLLAYEAAASQSKTQIADWLENPELMLDTSVWLIIDVAFQISFCILYAKRLYGSLSKKESALLAITLWFPGLLIFPVLFALLTELIFALPGVDFATIGWCAACAVVVAMPLMAYCLKWLLPEKDIRVELIFMVNLLIAALGIVATVNGRTAAVGTNSVEWGALAMVFAILLAGGIAGFLYNKRIITNKIKKLK